MEFMIDLSSSNSWERVFISVTDVFLFSVVQPCTYIIKTRQVKDLLSNSGWCSTLRQYLMLDSNPVSPAEEIEMNPAVNANRDICNRHQPIQTISEQVENRNRAISI